MRHLTVFLSFLLLIAGSCSQPMTGNFSQRKSTAKTRYVSQTNIVTFPLLVDMEVEDRLVTGTFSGSEISEEFAKDMAVANAIKQAGADVLVEPFYDISINSGNISVTVIGHPAHYGNFRKSVPDRPVSTTQKPTIKAKPEPQTKERFEQKTYEPPEPKIEEPPAREKQIEIEEEIVKEEPQPEIHSSPEQPPVAEEAAIRAVEEAPDEVPEQAHEEPESDGRLITPCYIIGYSAMARESDAQDSADQLTRKGLKAGYFWIPDYDRGGKSLFRVYVGPYSTRDEADNMLPRVKQLNSGAYVMQLK